MSDEVMIAVDLGGTRIRAARLDKQLNILERHEKRTEAERGLEPTLQRIKNIIHKVLPTDDTPVVGIGLSAPGPLNPETGVVVAPPNLPGWQDVPLMDIMQDEFGCPVYVGNDANVAALAEVSVGAAKGYRHVIYLTVSTGIGSGIIYDGRLLLGQAGLAAEAGHMAMVVDGDRVSTLEKEAAGPALARHAQQALREGADSSMREMVNSAIDAIDGEIVGKAAQAGDDLALSIVRRGGRMVGLGLVSLLHLFNPEIIVVGGGVSNLGDLLFEPMREAVKAHVLDEDYWTNTPIIRSEISEDVSIYGSATLVLTEGGKLDLTQIMRANGILQE